MKKHSVELSGHQTSIAIEDEFWFQLKEIAKQKKTSLRQLLIQIDNAHQKNLASALRLFVLKYQIEQNTHAQQNAIEGKQAK